MGHYVCRFRRILKATKLNGYPLWEWKSCQRQPIIESDMKDLAPRGQGQFLRSDRAEPDYIDQSSGSEEVHLSQYLKVLLKRRRLILIVFFAVFIPGAYCVFTATRLYKATSTLKIDPQNPSVITIADVRTEVAGQPDYLLTQIALLQSRTLAAKVIEDLQLESNPAFTRARVIDPNPLERFQDWSFGLVYPTIHYVARFFESPPPDRAQSSRSQASKIAPISSLKQQQITAKPDSKYTGKYGSFLKVQPKKGTRLVDIQFSTPDPRLSQELANEHAARFIRMNYEARFELTSEARDFLDKKNVELKEKLQRAEHELNQFRQQHGVVSVDRGENIVVDRLVDLNRQLTTARAQRIEAESLYKVVESKSMLSLSQVIGQGLVPQLRSALLALETEKVKLSALFKPDHPRMAELNQQIAEARRSLNAEISSVVRGIQQNYTAARAKEQALEGEALKQQKTALDLKEIGVAYAVLEEEVKVNKTLYESVLKRLNETSVANDLAMSNMQIAQLAERPNSPSSPNIPFYLLLTAGFGIFLGMALAAVLEYFDSSVATPQHVWGAVALSTFGVVPDLNSLDRGLISYSRRLLAGPGKNKALPKPSANVSLPSAHLLESYHPLSVASEAFRTIRTSLLFSQAEKPPQVILVTSPSPGEGKTLTTLNLGIALAQDGRTVLVIDADMRKGCCHARLGLTNHDGLSNVLAGKLSLQEALKKTNVEGLSLLSRGITPPNPADLLGSQMMRKLVDQMRESYEFILIDSPPAIAVADAAILSVFADGVLLVLHAKTTTKAYARQVVERLDSVRATFLGVVLNGIDVGNPDYSYYKRYYGSYYGGETKAPNNGTTTSAGTDQSGLHQTSSRFEEVASGLKSSEFVDHLITKLNAAIGLQERVDKIGAILRSNSEFRPKMSENETKQTLDVNIKDQHQQANKGFSESGSGTVSREFLNHLIEVFYERVGPMAHHIVRGEVVRLGESFDSFPKNRLKELIDHISMEIINDELKEEFRRTMSNIIELNRN
jgi:polysaccharide biosynthesis transport protein